MKVPVHMVAYHGKNVIREVDIPDLELTNDAILSTKESLTLEGVFHYGQNDFQPVPNRCSVSVGDVIELNGEYFAILAVGFRKITSKDFDKLPDTPLGADAYKIEQYIATSK